MSAKPYPSPGRCTGCIPEDCRQSVIIGYSLPAADFLVKRLFYRSLPCNRNLRELELVDRKNDPARVNPLMEKYRPILGDNQNTVKLACDKKNIGEYTQLVKSRSKSDII